MDLEITRETLRAALALPLRVDTWQASPTAAAAAVAIPIRLAPEPAATLVLRGRSLRDHAGEVGFPGGKPEPGDADLAATALREMEEEVAIRPGDVEVLGMLTPVPVITGRYLIHAFVALARDGAPHAPRVASPEIEQVLDVPLLPWITGARPMGGVEGPFPGGRAYAPHFELGASILYGASAFLFHELLLRIAAALGRELPAPRLEQMFPWAGRYGA